MTRNATTTTPTYVAITDAGTKHWHLGSIERAEVCYCGTRLMTPGDTRKFALKVDRAARNYQTDTQLDCIDCGACKRNREYRYATGLETRPATTTTTTTRRRRPATVVAETRTPEAEAEAGLDEHALASRTRRRRPQHAATVTADEAARLAEAAAATPEAADAAAPPSRRRRQSKADRAHAAAERDRERREALGASADATVAAIEAAVAEATGEPTLTASMAALIDGGVLPTEAAALVTPSRPRRARRPSAAAALVDFGLAADRADARAQLADMGE